MKERNRKWVDIPTMWDMTDEEYRRYIEANMIVFMDHHEIVRSGFDEYAPPIATSVEQLDILISILQSYRSWMHSNHSSEK